MKELCYINRKTKEITLEDKTIMKINDIKATMLNNHLIACFKNDENTYLIDKVDNNSFRRYKIDWLFKNN